MTPMDPEVMDYYDTEVTRLIVEKYGYSDREALPLFLESETYRMLSDSEMAFWQFGPEGVFNIWEAERITGSPRQSSYLRMK